MSVVFPRLGKCSAIILQIRFLPLSLSSSSGTLIMQICVHLMISLKLSSLYFILFLGGGGPLIGWIPLPCLKVHWSLLPLHLDCCWTPLFNFSVQLLYFSALWFLFGTFLCFLSLEIFILFMHCSVDLSEHLYDHYFELYFIRVCFWSFIFLFWKIFPFLFLCFSMLVSVH